MKRKAYYLNIYGDGKKNENGQLDAVVYVNFTDAKIGADGNIPVKTIRVISSEVLCELLNKFENT